MPAKKRAAPKDESSNTPILIKTYGEFWSPEVVNWDNGKHKLWGKLRADSPRQKSINVWEQRGVYVLYEDFAPVYVGKADKQSIGHRLQLHRRSRRKGRRWNQFSWFGLKSLTKHGELKTPTLHAHAPTAELIATLEALLIIVIDPRLNARRERFKNAIPLYQSDEDKPREIDERLQTIENRLNELLKPPAKLKLRTPKKR